MVRHKRRVKFKAYPVVVHRGVPPLMGLTALSLLAVLLAPTIAYGKQERVAVYEVKKDWPLTMQKGSVVVLRVPKALWHPEKLDEMGSADRGEMKIELGFKEDRGAEGSAEYWIDANDVLGNSSRATAGVPYCADFTVTRVFEFYTFFRHRKLPFTEVQLRGNGLYVELHFAYPSSDAAMIDAQFRKLVIGGTWGDFEKSSDFRDNVFAKLFTGQLTALSEPAKQALFNLVCTGGAFDVEEFKGKAYFAFALIEPDAKVYNSNVVSSSTHVSTIINERILDHVKAFEAPAQEIAVDGLKFSAVINYRNFANEQINHTDDLQIYLPLSLCGKFADADITSQQLINGSIVLLNGNRIQVSLAGSQ